MSKIEIIRKYKKARNITDKYLLDSDEHYLVDEILSLQEQVKKLTIPVVVGTFFCQHKLVLDCKEQCHKCKQQPNS
jgi:hypothetical protein